MPVDKDRNRVLVALRDQPQGVEIQQLVQALNLPFDVVERHLRYCADYDLATLKKKKNGGTAVITGRGRDYLTRQGL